MLFRGITGGQMDWQSKIPLTDFEKAYAECVGLQHDSNGESDVTKVAPVPEKDNSESPINLSADTNNQDNNVLNRDVDSSAESAEQLHKNEDPDDIRIPDDAIETPDSITNPVADDACDKVPNENGINDGVTQNPVSHPTDSIDQMSSQLSELLDNLCLIVPSAFRLATDETPSGSLPFITFQPEYLRQINGDSLSTLDESMRMYTPDSYSFFTTPSHSSWIDAVRDVYNHMATEARVPPLYSLLILRFHSSLCDAYNAAATTFADKQELTASNSTVKEGSEDATRTLISNKNENCETASILPTIEADVKPAADSLSEEQPETASSTAENETHDDAVAPASAPDSSDILSLSSLLPSLFGRLGRLRDLSDEDATKLINGFKAHATDVEDRIHRLEDVFLLPFSLLLPKVATSNFDFEESIKWLNAGVSEVVEALEEQNHPASVLGSEPEPVAKPTAEDRDVEVETTGEQLTEAIDAGELPVQVDASVPKVVQDGGPGKKSKKKKKKKVQFILLRLK
jgi:hypothetical protein